MRGWSTTFAVRVRESRAPAVQPVGEAAQRARDGDPETAPWRPGRHLPHVAADLGLTVGDEALHGVEIHPVILSQTYGHSQEPKYDKFGIVR